MEEKTETINDGLRVIRDPAHLAFGSDALLLAGYLRRGKKAAELGAGTGAVSLLAAARGKYEEIDGYELQESAVAVFEKNITLNGLGGRVRAVRADLRELSGELAGRYDCVFSNPPYMKTGAGKVSRLTERETARHETAGGIEDFARAAARLLKTGGEAVFVYRPDRLCDLLSAMRQAGVEPKRMTLICADEEHAPSMALVSGKKGAAAGMIVTPVFFMNRGGEESEEYRYLNEKGEFPERYVKR